jgi:hypothetical protein
MNTRYKYIEFIRVPSLKPRKTDVWACVNIRSRGELGKVKWYPAWRQYCFFPAHETVFNSSCHNDISAFLDQLNSGHKAKNRRPRIGAES